MAQAKVYIAGAGPGRLTDLTWKAKALIEKADIIFYDRLINKNLLHLARAEARLVNVGKEPYGEQTSQESIEAQLIEAAKSYDLVLRLKGGDPLVFGRGAEEGQALAEAGIDFEIVPALTSALAGLTYGGIPATARDLARGIHIFTAKTKDGPTDFDWQALASLEGTLVFMMGMKELENIQACLLQAGMDPKTPAAVIQWASRSRQAKVTGRLDEIFSLAQEAGMSYPALIAIGQVIEYEPILSIFEKKLGFGSYIALPHTAHGEMALEAEDLGAELVLYQAQVKGKIKEVPADFYQDLNLVIPDEPAFKGARQAFPDPEDIRTIYTNEVLAREVRRAYPATDLIISSNNIFDLTRFFKGGKNE